MIDEQQWITRSHILVTRFLGLALFAFSCSVVCSQDKLEIYQDRWALAQQTFAAGEFSEALHHYRKVAELFPYEPSCQFEMARCYVKLEKQDEALRSLSNAIELGWCDVDRIKQSPEFKPLEKLNAYDKMISAAEACREEKVLLYEGEGIEKQQPVCLIVLLHGLGCGPRAELPYWKQVADKLGCVVVAPRAATQLSPLLFGWQFAKARDSYSRDFFDTKSAQSSVNQAIEVAQEQYNIAPEQIVLAGFSQGAGVAIQVFGEQADRFRGFIGIGGLYPPLGAPFWKGSVDLERRVVIMAGERDPLLSRSQQLAKELEQAGIKFHFSAEEETGHEYPPDHAKRLTEAMKFILEH